MKHIIFSLGLILTLFASCQKSGEESRYYVKYSGSTSTLHMVETTYTVNGETGQVKHTITGFSSDYTVTIGPVKKGFQTGIVCECMETESYYIKSQYVTIEVSKDNDPFALKASGTNQASYTIDY